MKLHFCNSRIQEMPFVIHFATALDMNQNTLKAKYILNAVFQTLTARIPFFASDALIGHLPKDVQPLFKDNCPHRCATDFDYDEFINALYESSHIEHCRLFCSTKEVETAVSTLFEVIKERLTEQQHIDLMLLMPLTLRMNLLNDYVFEGHLYIF
jgi:uncharacterized protein (DUF2267 family)